MGNILIFDRFGKILFNSHYQGLLNLVKILSKK